MINSMRDRLLELYISFIRWRMVRSDQIHRRRMQKLSARLIGAIGARSQRQIDAMESRLFGSEGA